MENVNAHSHGLATGSRSPGGVKRRKGTSKRELLGRSRDSLDSLFGKHRGQLVRLIMCFPFVLLAISAFISFLFSRGLIRLTCWWGMEPEIRRLRAKLHAATSIGEYEAIACELDRMTGCERWKTDPRSSSYDWKRVLVWTKALRQNRTEGHIHRVCEILANAQTLKFGRVFGEDVFSYTHWGTKNLIEDFYAEIETSLCYILRHVSSTEFKDSPCPEISRFICDFAQRWGKTALYLSGGGMIGFHHFGVGKALLQMDLVPRILVGCSAGSAVAAWLGSRQRSDAVKELDGEVFARVFQPFEGGSLWSRLVNLLFLGYLCPRESWYKCARRVYKDLTLAEAYSRTGRVLNIAATRADEALQVSSGVYILNHKTAPNVLLTSAILASSAFPFLSAPFCLTEKSETGDTVPSARFPSVPFQDGCLMGDVPTSGITREFNVGFGIVSQVNPHVYPFLGLQARGRAGRPARKSLVKRGASLLTVLGKMEEFFKEIMVSIIRLGISIDVWPTIKGMQTEAFIDQTYTGDVTLLPRRIFWGHRLAASNIVRDRDVRWYLQEGMTMTFEKTYLIRARLRMERLVENLSSQIYQSASPSPGPVPRAIVPHLPLKRDRHSELYSPNINSANSAHGISDGELSSGIAPNSSEFASPVPSRFAIQSTASPFPYEEGNLENVLRSPTSQRYCGPEPADLRTEGMSRILASPGESIAEKQAKQAVTEGPLVRSSPSAAFYRDRKLIVSPSYDPQKTTAGTAYYHHNATLERGGSHFRYGSPPIPFTSEKMDITNSYPMTSPACYLQGSVKRSSSCRQGLMRQNSYKEADLARPPNPMLGDSKHYENIARKLSHPNCPLPSGAYCRATVSTANSSGPCFDRRRTDVSALRARSALKTQQLEYAEQIATRVIRRNPLT